MGYRPWGCKRVGCDFATKQQQLQLLCAQLFSRIQLFAAAWTIALQAPLSMEFSSQEYWSELPFPSPSDLPDPGIELGSLVSPTLARGFFIIVPPGKPIITTTTILINVVSSIFWYFLK